VDDGDQGAWISSWHRSCHRLSALPFDAVDSRFGFDPTKVFDPVAEEYRSVRPGYPGRLYDALEAIVGDLDGKAVADVGAGTGIATSALAARGGRVVAVEPSLAMLGRFHWPAVAGRAEALPLRSASHDLLTCAQAWHWVEPRHAVVECRRVLRTGGHLALWWNISESGDTWLEEVESVSGVAPYGVGRHQDDPDTLTFGDAFAGVQYRDVRWTWTVPVERWIKVATTRSSSVNRLRQSGGLPEDEMRAVLDRHFPNGQVTEVLTCHLAVATAV